MSKFLEIQLPEIASISLQILFTKPDDLSGVEKYVHQ